MPQISRTALVPFSAEQMYQLVNDVKSYPDFLPGCTGSRRAGIGADANDGGG
ncbi:oligoketide cyclase/lipid transport protein [Klebsiella pneumoniae]|uniref:Oligoketide cyclase/lipid transport protein n=1 Tax=Klebsiella pneumoniae TaxID=573 RepID=A0A377WRX0_KLEPN|nr:oligoketide cyclase/lipid transport protein [Klebsiella pneumoniae]